MVKALAEDRLTGHINKKDLQDNLDKICDTLIFTFHIKDVDFLKVAWAISRNIFFKKEAVSYFLLTAMYGRNFKPNILKI